MDLFENDPKVNLLPYDGTVNYHGPIFSAAEDRHYQAALTQSVPWKNDEAVIFGKHIITARKVAWYGDAEYPYAYSGITRTALSWNADLIALKARVEEVSGCIFNSCLLNLYHNGNEGMGWHSDDEKALLKEAPIASVSLGAERKFNFKHRRTQALVSVMLESGSLLVMKGTTQTHWLHSLPKATRITEPRINLTFRTIATA